MPSHVANTQLLITNYCFGLLTTVRTASWALCKWMSCARPYMFLSNHICTLYIQLHWWSWSFNYSVIVVVYEVSLYSLTCLYFVLLLAIIVKLLTEFFSVTLKHVTGLKAKLWTLFVNQLIYMMHMCLGCDQTLSDFMSDNSDRGIDNVWSSYCNGWQARCNPFQF